MRHETVSRDDWIAARKALMKKEKELTRLRDALSAERRALPWVKIDKTYVFETPGGKRTLAELFDGRSQLIVQHFMFAPDWEEGCVGCSFEADHVDAAWMHLQHHDVSYVAVARAPVDKLAAYWKRMGWRLPFASSAASDFNYDFHVSFTEEALANGRVTYNYDEIEPGITDLPGASVFFRDDGGTVFHTYSSFARGNEEVIGAYMLLDITPNGRNEAGPNRDLTDWVRRHDEYEDAAESASCCAS